MYSCDTFVALKDVTESGHVIFGKNSDRPYGEVQEVVHVPRKSYPPGAKLRVQKTKPNTFWTIVLIFFFSILVHLY